MYGPHNPHAYGSKSKLPEREETLRKYTMVSRGLTRRSEISSVSQLEDRLSQLRNEVQSPDSGPTKVELTLRNSDGGRQAGSTFTQRNVLHIDNKVETDTEGVPSPLSKALIHSPKPQQLELIEASEVFEKTNDEISISATSKNRHHEKIASKGTNTDDDEDVSSRNANGFSRSAKTVQSHPREINVGTLHETSKSPLRDRRQSEGHVDELKRMAELQSQHSTFRKRHQSEVASAKGSLHKRI